MQEQVVPEEVAVEGQSDPVSEAPPVASGGEAPASDAVVEQPALNDQKTTVDEPFSEQPRPISDNDLVDKIIELDDAFSEDDRPVLLNMGRDALQIKANDEQRDHLTNKIISENPTLNQANEAAIKVLKEAYKDIPLEQLELIANQNDPSLEALQEKVANQQEDLSESGAGLDRDSLPSPDLTETDSSAEEITRDFNAFELEENWLGKDGKGGLIRGALRSQHYEAFNEAVLQEEQKTQAISREVQAEVFQEYSNQQENRREAGDTVVVSSLEEYMAEESTKQKIAEMVKDRINAKIDEKVEEKFQEIFTTGIDSYEDFVAIVANESLEDLSDDDSDSEDVREKKSRKRKLLENLTGALFAMGDFTANSFENSDFGTFLSLLLSRDAADLHRSAFSNNPETKDKTQVYDKEFKAMVFENKENGESTFMAYDKVFRSLAEEYSRLTSTENKDLLEKLDDGDTEGLQKKAKKLYELFFEKISKENNIALVNKVFVRVFGGSGDLKGNFGDQHTINEKVLDLLYSFKDTFEYQKIISEN